MEIVIGAGCRRCSRTHEIPYTEHMTASIAFYTLTIYGGFFLLSVLPCLFKPWEMGVKMYMPLKLPTDQLVVKQLTYMQAFLAVGMIGLVGQIILAAFFLLTKTFVIAFMAMFVIGIIYGVVELKGEAGVDPKAMGAQLTMQAIVVVALAVSLLVDEYDELPEVSIKPDVSSMVTFVGGFFILSNVAGIVAPSKLLAAYLPDETKRPQDKYGSAQLGLFIRFACWTNTTQGLFLILVATSGIDYYPFLLLQICMSPLFIGFFIAFIKAEIGFDDKAMIFWMIFVSFTTGYFGLACQQYYA